MHAIVYDVFSVFIASVVFSISYFILSKIENRKYLLYWCFSWAFFSASLFLRVLVELGIFYSFFPLFGISLTYFSSLFMLIGTLRFLNIHKQNKIFTVFMLVWLLIVVSFIFTWNKDVLKYVVFVISALIFIYSGSMLYKYTRNFGYGGRIAGAALIVWGLHKADYPLAEKYEMVLVFGYQFTILLTLVTSLGIILMHFEKTKRDIQDRESNFRNIAEASKDIVFSISFFPETKINYISSSVENITGYNPAEIIYSEELSQSLFIDHVIKYLGINNIYKKMDSEKNRHEITAKNGRRLILEFTCMEYYGLDGSVERVVGFAANMTDRLLAFDSMIDRRDWYEAIFQKSNVIKMLVNYETGTIADANSSMERFTGYLVDEIRGEQFRSLFAEDFEAEKFWDKPEDDSMPERYRLLTKNGEIKNVAINTSSLFFEDQKYLYVNIADISSEIFFENELKNITTLHSAILESINEGVIGVDREGRIFFVNTFALNLLGFESAELLGKDHHTSIHYRSDDGELSVEDCPIMNAIHKSQRINNYRDYFVKKSGELIPVDVTLGQLIYYNDEPKCIIIFRDISEELENERKMMQQLEDNMVLLREVHHRVKNNLQIICSLLSLQMDTMDNEEHRQKLNDSIARIKSMSLIHEMLYRTQGLSSIKLDVYIEKLVVDLNSMLGGGQGVSVALEIDNISLSLDQAVPCGLIVTELFTNALKHAFTDGMDEKIIEVGFVKSGGRNILWVKDSGRGVPDEKSLSVAGSLGMTIVNSLAKQLGGSISYKNCGGLKVEIIF